MSDIVERLRAFAGDTPGWAHSIFGEAAAEIERLRALVATLANDLEEELRGHYGSNLDYPSERRRFERDMANVYEARRALEGK